MKTRYHTLLAVLFAGGIATISASSHVQTADPMARLSALEARINALEARIKGGKGPRSGSLSSARDLTESSDSAGGVAAAAASAGEATGVIAMSAHPHRPTYLDTRVTSPGARSARQSPLRREVRDSRADDVRTDSPASTLTHTSRSSGDGAFSTAGFSQTRSEQDAEEPRHSFDRAGMDAGRPPRHDGARRAIATRAGLRDRHQSDPRVDTPHPSLAQITGSVPAPVGKLY